MYVRVCVCVQTMAHEQFNISNGHRIREKKNNKNKDLTYFGERETYNMFRNARYYIIIIMYRLPSLDFVEYVKK